MSYVVAKGPGPHAPRIQTVLRAGVATDPLALRGERVLVVLKGLGRVWRH